MTTNENSINNALVLLTGKPTHELTAEQKALLLKIRLGGQSKNTHRAYDTDIAIFERWYTLVYGGDLPDEVPEIVIMSFLLDMFLGSNPAVRKQMQLLGYRKTADVYAYATVARMLCNIGKRHVMAGFKDPTKSRAIRELIRDIRRNRHIQTHTDQLKPIDGQILDAMLAVSVSVMADIRDKALLLTAYNSGGRRVSEIESANIEHFQPRSADVDGVTTERWYEWTIRHQKNDQEGAGHTVPVRGAAAEALRVDLQPKLTHLSG